MRATVALPSDGVRTSCFLAAAEALRRESEQLLPAEARSQRVNRRHCAPTLAPASRIPALLVETDMKRALPLVDSFYGRARAATVQEERELLLAGDRIRWEEALDFGLADLLEAMPEWTIPRNDTNWIRTGSVEHVQQLQRDVDLARGLVLGFRAASAHLASKLDEAGVQLRAATAALDAAQRK
jgi:hypothetical protein